MGLLMFIGFWIVIGCVVFGPVLMYDAGAAKVQETWEKDSVARGFAEYYNDENGDTKWRWKDNEKRI